MTLIPVAAGSGSPVEQRATLGPRVCSRPGCGRAFQPRRSGGRPPELGHGHRLARAIVEALAVHTPRWPLCAVPIENDRRRKLKEDRMIRVEGNVNGVDQLELVHTTSVHEKCWEVLLTL